MRQAISILFTWNPKRFDFPEYEEIIESTRQGVPYIRRWSSGIREDVQVGDRALLLRQKLDRGIIGFGTVVSEVFRDDTWDQARSNQVRYVQIEWKVMRPADNRITHEWLMENLGDANQVSWNMIYAGGYKIPEDVADVLENILTRR
jgi:hypothetical protein